MTFIQKYGYILMIILVSSAFTVIGVLKEKTSTETVEIQIVQGDTLWALAQNFSEDGKPDKWIREVLKMNDMDSTMIKSGTTLKMPATAPALSKLTEIAGEE